MSTELSKADTQQQTVKGHSPAKSPRIITDGATIRQVVRAAQRAGQTVGLVPTMGALHEGHLSLIDASCADCDLTVTTIFVNPTQFSPREDYKQYPRDLDQDVAQLGRRGCDLIFAPSIDEMYASDHATFVDVGPIGTVLEGEIRPTHFRGVATVVLKLFQFAPADRAYFGRKDYQQTLVVRQMVEDLNVPMEICVCPIVREPDGMALSSRNAYLSPAERQRAQVLSQSLRLAEQLAAGGERDATTIDHQVRSLIEGIGGVDVQYIAFVVDGTVNPVQRITGPTTVAIAALVGKTRLIDNTRIG